MTEHDEAHEGLETVPEVAPIVVTAPQQVHPVVEEAAQIRVLELQSLQDALTQVRESAQELRDTNLQTVTEKRQTLERLDQLEQNIMARLERLEAQQTPENVSSHGGNGNKKRRTGFLS